MEHTLATLTIPLISSKLPAIEHQNLVEALGKCVLKGYREIFQYLFLGNFTVCRNHKYVYHFILGDLSVWPMIFYSNKKKKGKMARINSGGWYT